VLCHEVGEHSINANGGEQHRKGSKGEKQRGTDSTSGNIVSGSP